jgi:ribosomal protein S18 acetylase RimI-like enzyme
MEKENMQANRSAQGLMVKMPSDVRLRIVKKQAEVGIAIQLLNGVIRPPLLARINSIDDYANKLCKYAIVLLAEEKQDLIGVAAMYANDMDTKQAYLAQIGVSRSHQGMGVGKLLLSRCVEIAKKRSMTTMKLEVGKNNLGAIAFYLRYGFVAEKTVGASHYMVKSLS